MSTESLKKPEKNVVLPLSCVPWGTESVPNAVLDRHFPCRGATVRARRRDVGPSFLGGLGEALGDARVQQVERGPIDEVKKRHLGDAVARLLQGTAPLMRLDGLGRADTEDIPEHTQGAMLL